MKDELGTHPGGMRGESPANPVHVGVERAIHEHRLPPGTRLAEAELCDIYDVSRTIVRAGLQSLAHSRLVTVAPNRGARVAKPSPEEAQQVFEARELIEPRTARQAAVFATSEDVRLLQKHNDEERAALEASDYGRALRLSGAFHIEIARISRQMTLMSFVEQLVARSALIIALYWRNERMRCDRDCHCKLIDAIAGNHAEEAEALMRSHLVDIHSGLNFGLDDPKPTPLREMLSP